MKPSTALFLPAEDLALERQLGYWKKRLAGAPALLELPTDRPRPPVQTFREGQVAFTVPKEVAVGLQGVGRRAGATPFMTLYGAFAVLLSRWSGQEDLVIGSLITRRRDAALEPLIGFLVNALALRADLSGDPTFRELLGRIKAMTLEAYAQQDLPFDRLVEELQPTRSLSYTPLFQVMLVFQNEPVEAIDLGELKATPLGSGYEVGRFDLRLGLEEVEEGLRSSFVYNADLFDDETIGRMADQFQMLLEGIVAEPEGRISELTLLRGAERHRIVVEWNQTVVDYPKDRCLHELVEEQAEHTPEAVAAVFGSTQLTYRQLNDQANQLAHHLQKLGVGPDTLVGICLERSLEMVVGLLGILKAGGAYVPLDPGYPKERLAFMINDSGAPVLLTQQRLRDQLQVENPNCRILCLDADWGTIAKSPTRNSISGVSPENLAYVIYTSGSTGLPKGVMITHRSLSNHMRWLQATFPLMPSDNVLQKASIAFDVSVLEFWAPLLAGARLVLAELKRPADIHALIRTIREHQITFVSVVPSLLRMLVDEKDFGKCESLRRVFCGAEELSADLQNRFLSAFKADLIHLYGPTECTIEVTWWRCQRGSSEPIVPIGRPVANTQAYIFDRAIQPVPPGITGELHIGGVQLARGYLGKPELTAEKFVPNPFGEGRLYKTGDLARYRSDGAIEFLGRIDSQVKIRGFRIELGEIETVLRQHPSVQESIVIAREGIPGDKRLVAYVVPRDHTPGEERLTRQGVSRNGAANPSELREFLRVKLPDYMVPAAFVPLAALPLTPNGKIDRKALPEPQERELCLEQYVAPRNPTEEILAGTWAEVLGLKRVGIHDNFFSELGGDSLQAVRIFCEIHHILGRRLPLATLFEAPTIEKLAQKVAQEPRPENWKPLVAIQSSGARPPFFGIHGADGNVLFYRRLSEFLGREQPFYGLQSQGLDGNPITRLTVETIAAYYLEEIRTVQPQGPYLLGGYSFGGLASYEIARRLLAAGEEVALLVLFDTSNPSNPPRARSWVEVARRRIPRLLSRGTTPEHVFDYFAHRIRGKLGARLLSWNERFHSLTTRQQNDPARLLDVQIRMAHARASLAYRPRPYPGKITLFRTLDQPIDYEAKPDLGWSTVAEGGVDIHEVPGNHKTLFWDDNLQALARKVEQCIQSSLATN